MSEEKQNKKKRLSSLRVRPHFFSGMYSIISLKSEFSALQILHKASVVTFSHFVILVIVEVLIPERLINSFFV